MFHNIFIPRKGLSSLIAVLLLLSCRQTEKNNQKLWVQLREGLDQSNELIEAETKRSLFILEDKTKDASTAEIANIWYPNARRIYAYSKAVCTFADSLPFDSQHPENWNRLYLQLIDYRENLKTIDQEINYQYSTALDKISASMDSIAEKKQDGWHLPAQFSFEARMALLSRIKLEVRRLAFGMISFCNHKSTSIFCGYYEINSLFAGANTTHLLAGQTLEITAGIASFSLKARPAFIINGRPVPTDADGVAIYRLKVKAKPGKYRIPLSVEFFNTMGKKTWMKKDIEYMIDSIPARH